MKLSIIIPTYNEKDTIAKIIQQIKMVNLGSTQKEIIVVDDGSKDGTQEIIKKIPGIRYIMHRKNLGKGGAIKTGLKTATGEIIIFQDADLEYTPTDYPSMIKPIILGQTEVTNGIRTQPKHDIRKRKPLYWLTWLGNQTITITTNLLYCNNANEYEGCYKAFTKNVLDSIKIKTNNFDFDNELMCKLLKLGYKPVDVPIHYYPRDYKEGKKINWKHGFLILGTIVKTRFTD